MTDARLDKIIATLQETVSVAQTLRFYRRALDHKRRTGRDMFGTSYPVDWLEAQIPEQGRLLNRLLGEVRGWKVKGYRPTSSYK